MSNIPVIDNWKWYHAPIAIGVPVFVGAFFMETTPVFHHGFWLSFSLSLVLLGMVGMTATRRKRNTDTGTWDWVWKNTVVGWVLSAFFVLAVGTSAYVALGELL